METGGVEITVGVEVGGAAAVGVETGGMTTGGVLEGGGANELV